MIQQILLIHCLDSVGLISKITSVIADSKLNIIIMREFVEPDSKQFFARFELEGSLIDESFLIQQLHQVLPKPAFVQINPKKYKDIVVLVTKEHHCLGELLIRNHYHTLSAHIKAVIGNHEDLKDICDRFGVPFLYISHDQIPKEIYEAQLLEHIRQFQPDFIVLAKYMRILSDSFVQHFVNKIINIHHSFLPAFIGANPYKQAYERGVKLIGATAHFVNNQLDEGPIIAQEIISVDHTFSVQSMRSAGHEVEKSVLSHALRLVFQDRVFVVGNKTIVFD